MFFKPPEGNRIVDIAAPKQYFMFCEALDEFSRFDLQGLTTI